MTNELLIAHSEYGSPCGDEGMNEIAKWAGDFLLFLKEEHDQLTGRITIEPNDGWRDAIERLYLRAGYTERQWFDREWMVRESSE
jgi:hypothetical protein